MEQRDADRGLDVAPLAHDAVRLTVGASTQQEGATVRRHPPRDALAERHADLLPELALDAHRDADAKLPGLRVEQHQRSLLGADRRDGDLEHALEQLIGVHGEVDRVDDLVQGLEQLALAVARAASVAPQQPGGER